MDLEPLVSVVIPVFNSEKSIIQTLSSVKEQTFGNIEIIVVNDGSTDASETKIKIFIAENPECTIHYYFQKNQGVSAARNVGLKNAKGKYIALLDSDDMWDKEKISKQVHIMEENEDIDLLATNRNGEFFKRFLNVAFERVNHISPKLLMLKNFLITPTVVLKKEILTAVGYFNEKLKYAEDYEFLIRCTKYSNCYLLNESLVTTGSGKPTFGHSGLSSQLWEMEKGELKALKLGLEMHLINKWEYYIISAFSFSKFLRRWVVTKTR